MEFEALVNQHKDAVYRQILRVCGGNHEDAEDVLVDTMLRAWRHMDQLKEPLAFRGWLAQIGRRVCWHLRGREALLPVMQLSALREEGGQISSAVDPMEDRIHRNRMTAIVHQAISALPAELAAVYRLRDLDGLPGDQTSRLMGITEAAMKSRLHRARKQIRIHLDNLLAGEKS